VMRYLPFQLQCRHSKQDNFLLVNLRFSPTLLQILLQIQHFELKKIKGVNHIPRSYFLNHNSDQMKRLLLFSAALEYGNVSHTKSVLAASNSQGLGSYKSST
jgi:hypothetical protein